MALGANTPQIVSWWHGTGEHGVWHLEILEVDCGAVVKDLVAAALLQLTLKHQCAVEVQLYMPRTNVKVLQKNKQGSCLNQ